MARILLSVHGMSQLRGGDLLSGRVGANRADCCALPTDSPDVNCANIVARPTPGGSRYLESYARSPAGKAQLLGMTTRFAQGVINTRSAGELIVPFPPADIQNAIVSNSMDIAAEVDSLSAVFGQKLTALAELEQPLLHKAFSGEHDRGGRGISEARDIDLIDGLPWEC